MEIPGSTAVPQRGPSGREPHPHNCAASPVYVIALETTERIGSVAALSGGKVLADQRLPPDQRSAGSLAAGLRDLLAAIGWQPGEIDLVATCIGPGSFTGLRVGVTTAKVLAYCAGADVLGVDTLEVIAAGCPEDVQAVSVAVDAQRGQVVAGAFQRDAQGWPVPTGAPQLLDIDAWLRSLPPEIVIGGPILHKIADRVPENVRMLDPQCWAPSAAVLARLAEHHYAAGHRDDLWKLVPRYSRRSAAEEKWEAKRKG